MLQTKEGDLFANLTPPCIILHGCNAQGKMASGFAKALREKFPDTYKVYKTAQAAHGLKLGDINGYSDYDGYTIINGITQERYGRDTSVVYVDYDAVDKVCNTVARYVLEKGGEEATQYPVHMPFIGGGLANGDREKLLEIFTKAFEKINVTLWLDKPQG